MNVNDATERNLTAVPAHATARIGGETVWLLPSHALWWPAQRMMIVADVHFGKAATYRALGQPVPSGTTNDNLGRLVSLTETMPVRDLVFLGDFLHARSSRTATVMEGLHRWRDALPDGIRCTLVRGNHDLRSGDPPPSLRIDVRDEPWRVGPLALCHMPGAASAGSDADAGEPYELAGHLHPAYTLRVGSDALRLPCFLMRTGGGILPSFGAFTGNMTVRRQPGDRIYVIGDGRVWRVPSKA